MDIIQFFGRFHVLVLHLPIGILMLSALMELYTNLKHRPRNELLNWVWFWGAISAIVACVLGWLLSLGDGYTPAAIFIHRSFGLSVAVTACLCWWFFKNKSKTKTMGHTLAVLQLVLLFATGHYGANMTHGETYLVDKAPNFVRVMAGFEPHAEPRPPVTSLSDAHVFDDLVAPMLKQRCTSCHNEAKQKGQLNLATIDGILKGGRSGPAVVANDLTHSELYQRITLEHDAKEFMPAEGKTPLSHEQVKTLAWWIDAGAPTQGVAAEYQLTQDDQKNLQQVLGLTPSAFDLPVINPISAEQYESLTTAKFVVKQVSQDMNYLDVDYSAATTAITKDKLAKLLAVKKHIVYLNLRRAEITDELASILPQFTNLKRLRIEKNPIGDDTIKAIAQLPKLTYLNLYQTQISSSALPILATLPALTHLYLGDNNIPEAQLSEFINTTEINVQAVLAPKPANDEAPQKLTMATEESE